MSPIGEVLQPSKVLELVVEFELLARWLLCLSVVPCAAELLVLPTFLGGLNHLTKQCSGHRSLFINTGGSSHWAVMLKEIYSSGKRLGIFI